MKLNPHQFAAALGHSASMASGIRAMFGTDTKTLHMGRGAQNGILAARLAAQDFGSCPRAVESWARLVSTTVQEDSVCALITTGNFEILENTFKPYPCGIVIHPLIDAALLVHQKLQRHDTPSSPKGGPVHPREVEAIRATVNPQCIRLCSVRHPSTGLETIFSLYHGIAVALLFGQAGPTQFSDESCKDEPTRELRAKIQVDTDSQMKDDAAILRIKIHGQEEQIFEIEHATGSLARPMTSRQLEQKFMELSEPIVGAERASTIIQECWSLEQVWDMCDFVRLLVPP
jgi:aconitate decarboxylase